MHSKSDDPVDRALSGAVDDVLARLESVTTTAPVIVIDGRSGAGKSSLSRRLRDALPAAHVLALDSVYPGWDGLRGGADQVLDRVLRPRSVGAPGEWTGWDWQRNVPGGSHVVPSDGILIIEGAGVLTPASARLADIRVWVEAPDDDRRRRALLRDGDTYAPHWERWARQEDAHIAANHPQHLADLVVAVPAG